MITFIVSIPQMATCDKQDVKARIVEENVKILKRDEFPATAFVNVTDLIGDPNRVLSDSICEMLFEHEILTRSPHLDNDGKQLVFEKKPLWDYAWLMFVDFAELPSTVLEEVAWDLRSHRNFVHFSVVDDTPQKELDDAEEEEYDSSSDTESSLETDEEQDD